MYKQILPGTIMFRVFLFVLHEKAVDFFMFNGYNKQAIKMLV